MNFSIFILQGINYLLFKQYNKVLLGITLTKIVGFKKVVKTTTKTTRVYNFFYYTLMKKLYI